MFGDGWLHSIERTPGEQIARLVQTTAADGLDEVGLTGIVFRVQREQVVGSEPVDAEMDDEAGGIELDGQQSDAYTAGFGNLADAEPT